MDNKIHHNVTIVDDDDDLDANPITLPDGTVLDHDGAERYGEEVADRAAADRGGPPSSTRAEEGGGTTGASE